MAQPSVFSYLDYRAFLSDWLTARKASDRDYSYAVFAAEGGCSKGALANVIRGARLPRTETLDAFARAMGLTPPERNYLGLLVELAGAPDLESRHIVMEKILSAERYRQVRYSEGEAESDVEWYFSSWYHAAIREMAVFPSFRDDPRWIASHLVPEIREDQAAETLAKLLELGFLARNPDGSYAQREIRFRSKARAQQAAIGHFHKGVVPELLSQIDPLKGKNRHVLAGLMAFPVAMMPELKRRLDELMDQMANLADDPALGDEREVYLLGVQLLPVTRLSGEPRR